MNDVRIVVTATWDAEAEVWVATSEDVHGLAVEADTQDALREKVLLALQDLLELNGFSGADSLPEIPVHIMSQQLASVPNPCR